VEKKFPHDHAVSRQILLEIANVFKTFFPNLLVYELRRHFLLREEFGMHPDDEHLFIVTAIKDSNVSPVGQAFHASPEIIMVEVLARWRFEGIHFATLWIHA
jgi:hypothetical protein